MSVAHTEMLFAMLDECFAEIAEYNRQEHDRLPVDTREYVHGRKAMAEDLLNQTRQIWDMHAAHIEPDRSVWDAIEEGQSILVPDLEEPHELLIAYRVDENRPEEWGAIAFGGFDWDSGIAAPNGWRALRPVRLAKIGPGYYAPDWYRNCEQSRPESRYGYRVHAQNLLCRLPRRFDIAARSI